ncbi:phosphoribosylformylglycinamidine cyclo-ligase, partial [Xanthomonas perforans]|nr:phosphoribosylformylglycinamidine cyclo-ligase [Xanthomonas perforans]
MLPEWGASANVAAKIAAFTAEPPSPVTSQTPSSPSPMTYRHARV